MARILRSILLASLFCITTLDPHFAHAQAQGPESGSIAGGVVISTDGFGISTTIPGKRENVRNKLGQPPFPDPENLFPASGPAGANEFYDTNTKSSATGKAPLAFTNFEGIPDPGGPIPPDPHIAAGPQHLLATVNSQFAIFDKAGNLLKLIDADNWYSRVLPNAGPCDPQIVYDHFEQRWIMIWIECSSDRFTLYLSVSDDDNPLGLWCNWRLPGGQNGSTPTGELNDYPKLGFDEHAIYVTANMFTPLPNGNFSLRAPQVRIIPKAQLLDPACGPVTWTDFWDLRDPSNPEQAAFTVVPCVTFGSPEFGYLISDSPYQTGTFMTVWFIIDPANNPSLFGINVPVVTSQGFPSNADQLGGSTTLIDVGGRRVRNAVYMDGSIWTAHSVPGGQNGASVFARYVRIDPSSFTTLEDAAYGADGFWYYYPAVTPDVDGNLFMTFTRSGHSEYAGARFTGRLANAPPGLQASSLLKAGEANYVRTGSGTRNRWGDYLGMALDPADGKRAWMLGEYAGRGRWGTWIGGVTYEPLPGKHLRVEPPALHFDTLEVGQASLPFAVLISNVGAEDLTITSLSKSSNEFTITGIPALPHVLPSFGEMELEVAFEPLVAGALSDSITVVSDDPNNPTRVIGLSGRALGTASLSGIVKDAQTDQPVKARLTFVRRGETKPRAEIDTDAAGAYSTVILEGIYDVSLLPEIPYPETIVDSVVHTLAGGTLDFPVKPAPILFVEADSAGTAGEIYRTLLDDLGFEYAVWNRNQSGQDLPADRLPLLAEPQVLLWASGERTTTALSLQDRESIIGHLDNGGRLVLTGDNLAENSPADDSLMSRYLGVAFTENTPQVVIRGFAGDPVGNGLITGARGDSKDQLQLTDSAVSEVNRVYHYGTTPGDTIKIAAVRAEHVVNDWRAVYFGFRLEEVTPLNRKLVLQRALDWLGATAVAVAERKSATLPTAYVLEQNYPNPFNPSTTISFQLPKATVVAVKVFDLLGQEVATLIDGLRPAGRHEVVFDASALAGGVYTYQLRTSDFVQTRKLVLLK